MLQLIGYYVGNGHIGERKVTLMDEYQLAKRKAVLPPTVDVNELLLCMEELNLYRRKGISIHTQPNAPKIMAAWQAGRLTYMNPPELETKQDEVG